MAETFLRPVAPVRCPHCRSRLTTKVWRYRRDGHVDRRRWCKRCRCVVVYVWEDDEDEKESWVL